MWWISPTRESYRRLAVLMAWLCSLPVLSQEGMYLMGGDARALGRGGTEIGTPGGAGVVVKNPAWLSWERGRQVEGFLILSFPRGSFSGEYGSDESNWEPGPAPMFSYRRDGKPFATDQEGQVRYAGDKASEAPGKGSFREHLLFTQGQREIVAETRMTSDWGWGVGVFPMAGGDVSVRTFSDLFPEGGENFTSLAVVGLGGGAGYRVSPDWSVGGSLFLDTGVLETDLMVAQKNDLMQGRLNSGSTFGQFYETTTGHTKVRGEIDSSLVPLVGGSLGAGVAWFPHDDWTWGWSYRSPTWFVPPQGEATIDFTRELKDSGVISSLGSQLILPNGGTQGLSGDYDLTLPSFRLPDQLGTGASWTPAAGWRLSTEMKWIRWSSTHDKMEVELQGGNNPDLNALIGGDDTSASLPLGWRDQWIAATGVEFPLTAGLQGRVGYHYATPLQGKSNATPFFPVFFSHTGTAGISYDQGAWGVDAAWVHAFPVDEMINQSRISPDLEGARVGAALDLAVAGVRYSF